MAAFGIGTLAVKKQRRQRPAWIFGSQNFAPTSVVIVKRAAN
jgi:hypothetical protein